MCGLQMGLRSHVSHDALTSQYVLECCSVLLFLEPLFMLLFVLGVTCCQFNLLCLTTRNSAINAA